MINWPTEAIRNAPDLPFDDEAGTRSKASLYECLRQCIDFQEEIAQDLGEDFKVKLLSTNRLLLTSADGVQQLVAYMADPVGEHNRLVLDEYIPELAPGGVDAEEG